ncbi:MAG: GNAT family N-acetyltransferase [archaeon]|nr:GNAT family N-acetyltransferase [archaeon]
MVEFEIRMAMPEDKEKIELLTRALVDEKGEEFVEKRFEWGLLRRLFDSLQRHGIFLAEEKESGNKEIIGLLLGELIIDPFGISTVHIKHIFVVKEYRGMNVGKVLLENTINHLRTIEVKKIRLNLHLSSVKTKSLLEQANFKPKYTVMELEL